MTDLASTEPPLRVAVFGESVVSDWENPAATSWRALLRALTAAGHDVTFFERRRNRATVELLQARGAGPLRSFAARYPDVRYRTYDLPRGLERSVWFGREMATLDAVIVLDLAPPEIIEEIQGYSTPKLLRVLQRTGQAGAIEGIDEEGFDLTLAPEGGPEGGAVPFGPVVEVPTVQPAPPREGVVVVAYGDDGNAGDVAAALAPFGARQVTAGGQAGPWTFVPEVDLPERYRAAAVAVVLPAAASPLAVARLALPLAAGCPTLVAGRRLPPLPPTWATPIVTATTVAAHVARLQESNLPVPAVPGDLRADLVAGRLAQLVRAERLARLG